MIKTNKQIYYRKPNVVVTTNIVLLHSKPLLKTLLYVSGSVLCNNSMWQLFLSSSIRLMGVDHGDVSHGLCLWVSQSMSGPF